jgi:hypothetical protein
MVTQAPKMAAGPIAGGSARVGRWPVVAYIQQMIEDIKTRLQWGKLDHLQARLAGVAEELDCLDPGTSHPGNVSSPDGRPGGAAGRSGPGPA